MELKDVLKPDYSTVQPGAGRFVEISVGEDIKEFTAQHMNTAQEYDGHGAPCPHCGKKALVYLKSSRKQCFNCNVVIDASYDD